ncbi:MULTISPECIES: CU044_2847 family protein [Moorena]|uniref:Trypsin-co-occurring domain-containing protein n=1 Tax=Moorena producens 3L TaxID=489825 RepID=F4XJ56_9CYAN|nr:MULTISPECIES: CU044_2847 family protein [Moorena]EGJ35136.1 hypothetical protein LYNGBM3L_07400 [Moorena producens 3L]NEP65019.1 hypothetical protein [Moorena sp. SIO3A5]OLT65204.1 hypothetical protein BI334_09285 [Moorena producens 3L]
MSKIIPFSPEEGIVIYIEATENVDGYSEDTTPLTKSEEAEDDEEEPIKKQINKGNPPKLMVKKFQEIQKTIYFYTIHTLNSFRKVAIANVDKVNVNKVTLEFGIEIGGEAGIPYITKGTAKSNIKITAECSFPNNTD